MMRRPDKMQEEAIGFGHVGEVNVGLGTIMQLSGFYFYQNYFTLRMDIEKFSK